MLDMLGFFVVVLVGSFRLSGFKLYDRRGSLEILDVTDLFCVVDIRNGGRLNGVTNELSLFTGVFDC